MAIGSIAGPNIATVECTGLEIPFNVAPHKKIEPAVAVVINPCSACRPPSPANTGLLRDIGKRAVAVIVIEKIAAVTGDKQIGVPVVVIVSSGHSHAKTAALESRGFSDIFKSAIRLLAVKPIPVFGVALVRHF